MRGKAEGGGRERKYKPAVWNCGMFLAESHSERLLFGISDEKMTGNGNSFLYSVMQYTL